MKISEEQLECSHLLDQEGFINALCKEVVEENSWVRIAWSPQVIHRMVRYAYYRATIANELKRDVDIEIYVHMFFVISSVFDQQPDIANVLHDPTLTMEEKWKIIADTDQFGDKWEKLERESDEADFFPETKGRIEEAYPTTYNLPGFQKLYKKMRNEQYPFLEDGQALGVE